MFKLLNYFSLLSILLFNSCEAHTNQICTSTGGSGGQCGSAKFFLTTYHNCPNGQVPGSLHIQTPLGNTLTFSFSSYCPMSGFTGPGPNGNSLPGQCSQELSNKCGNSGADVTCYYRPDGVNMVNAVGDETCKAGNTMQYSCAYYAQITNAVTGNYIVWTTGTDINLDPCTPSLNPTGKIPCDFTVNNKVTIPLTIEGCGSQCGSPPTSFSGTDQNSGSSWTATVNQNSCSAAYDGIQCSVSCPSGFSQSGSLYCDNGNWINSFACVDQNYINYCHSASDCSGNGVTTDQNRQDGCDCTCNQGYLGSDCSVTASSPTSDPTVSQTVAPTPFPTNEPTDYPTNVPTDYPTNVPTDYPTNVPTDYPTNEPTDYPTNVPTDYPTNEPTNQPTSCPTDNPTESPSYSPTKNIVEKSNDDNDNKDLIFLYIFLPLGLLLLLLFLICRRRKSDKEKININIDIEKNEEENKDTEESAV